jgi:hypothetical protein
MGVEIYLIFDPQVTADLETEVDKNLHINQRVHIHVSHTICFI